MKLIIPCLIITLILLSLVGCQQAPIEPPPVNTAVPTITNISANKTRVPGGDSIQVSATIENVKSLSWSANGGTFTSTSANPTKWISPKENGSFNIVCTAKNDAGNSHASIVLTATLVAVPADVTAWWNFDTDFSEYLSQTKGTFVDSVSLETSDYIQGLAAASFYGTDPGVNSAITYPDIQSMKMGPSDSFTITMWIKTTDDQGWLIGRTFGANDYSPHGKGLIVDGGALGVDCSYVNGIDSNDPVNDGQWHNVAWVKIAPDSVILYIDGNNEGSMSFGGWSTDSTTSIVIGAANEFPGEGWPGTYQGLMDDVRFYPTALTADKIKAIANQTTP